MITEKEHKIIKNELNLELSFETIKKLNLTYKKRKNYNNRTGCTTYFQGFANRSRRDFDAL